MKFHTISTEENSFEFRSHSEAGVRLTHPHGDEVAHACCLDPAHLHGLHAAAGLESHLESPQQGWRQLLCRIIGWLRNHSHSQSQGSWL